REAVDHMSSQGVCHEENRRETASWRPCRAAGTREPVPQWGTNSPQDRRTAALVPSTAVPGAPPMVPSPFSSRMLEEPDLRGAIKPWVRADNPPCRCRRAYSLASNRQDGPRRPPKRRPDHFYIGWTSTQPFSA